MTRGKLLFMFGGLCAVAILLWIASALQEKPVPLGGAATTQMSAPVPGAGDFYVGGHVNRSGMYSMQSGETLRDAIARAGGGDSPAADLIVRLDRKEGGVGSTRSIPMTDVISGKSDETLKLGDMIDVVREARPATVQVPPMQPAGATPAAGGMP